MVDATDLKFVLKRGVGSTLIVSIFYFWENNLNGKIMISKIIDIGSSPFFLVKNTLKGCLDIN